MIPIQLDDGDDPRLRKWHITKIVNYSAENSVLFEIQTEEEVSLLVGRPFGGPVRVEIPAHKGMDKFVYYGRMAEHMLALAQDRS